MSKAEEFRLPSSDGRSQIHVMHWKPEKQAVAVLQISHGMIEHIRRYEECACALAKQGIAVIGHDHLGHGETAGTEEDFGFFSEKNGASCIVRDIYRVRKAAARRYPGIPHFILGHSMGSFFVRRYLLTYGRGEAGAILMGTGNQPLPLLLLGDAVVRLEGMVHGERFRSALLHQLVLGSYNRRVGSPGTESDWLSRDREKVTSYMEDPYCQFRFTCSAYRDFFDTMLLLKSRKQLQKMPLTLPVLMMSGEEDPVGDYGKGIRSLFRRYQKLGLADVKMKLYPGARHELLNETNREEVISEIASWIFSHLA